MTTDKARAQVLAETMVPPMLYFAYGSNMLFDQMCERCPSATFVCIASLMDYRLAFTRKATGAKSPWRGYGVADVIPAGGAAVWGAVFQIHQSDIARLDRSEGCLPGREKNAYRRVEVRVARMGNSNQPLKAQTYVACTREEPNPVPHCDYVARIIAGAKSWSLPEKYVRGLEQLEVTS